MKTAKTKALNQKKKGIAANMGIFDHSAKVTALGKKNGAKLKKAFEEMEQTHPSLRKEYQ